MKARVLVGRNIRRLRVARQLPQEGLGVAAGIEPSYVGRVERGRENVTVDLLEAIAAALDVEVSAFFTLPGGEQLPGLRAGRKPKARSTADAVGLIPAASSAVSKPQPEPTTVASAPPGSDEGVKGA